METSMNITLEELHVMLCVLRMSVISTNVGASGNFAGFTKEERQEISNSVLLKMRGEESVVEVAIGAKTRKMKLDDVSQ